MEKIIKLLEFRSIAILVLGMLAAMSCGNPLTQKDARPNILFIMSDDHAIRAVSAYGESIMQTPNIDRIASAGVLFSNSFVSNSICAPSRAVLLTGKLSHQNGQRGNHDIFDGSQSTFPKILRASGYQTFLAGKWHLKSLPTGFDQWEVLIGQGEYYSPRFRTADGDKEYSGAYVTDKISDIALAMLTARDTKKPFAMLYHHKAPHRNWMPSIEDLENTEHAAVPLPSTFNDEYEGRAAAKHSDMRIDDMFLSWDMKLQPGAYRSESGSGGSSDVDSAASQAAAVQNWRNAYDRLTSDQKEVWDAYYEKISASYNQAKDDPAILANWKYQRYLEDYRLSVRALDRNVGRMLDYLDENGLADNTIVVYTSDQGFYLGEHGWYDKRFMYEQSMRTPLMMSYPGVIPPGSTVDELVQNIDLAPTFLDYANLKVPEAMQGLSLADATNDQKGIPWRDALYYHYYDYPSSHLVKPHYGIRTDRYKLMHFYHGENAWEMYDLHEDPDEMVNLYGRPEFAKLQARLYGQLIDLREQYAETTKTENA